jgi:hypothetical protein
MFPALREDGAIQVWGTPVRSRGDGFARSEIGFSWVSSRASPGPVMLVTLKIRRSDRLLLLLVSGGREPPEMLPVQFCKSEYAPISVRPTWHANK